MEKVGEWLKRRWWLVLSGLFFVALLLSLGLHYRFNVKKSFWDFLESLVIPSSLAAFATFLQWLQKRQEDYRREAQREHDESKTKEDALENYFNSITQLLNELTRSILQHSLTEEQEEALKEPLSTEARLTEESRRDSARSWLRHDLVQKEKEYLKAISYARTVSVLRRLSKEDSERKASVVQFLASIPLLYDGLNLANTDLSHVDLFEINLGKADLSRANLSGANLTGAVLLEANLTGANLSGAILVGADLSSANLSGAILVGADLSGANLSGAIIRNVDFSSAITEDALMF